MSKYYLTNAVRNSTVKATAVLTGSYAYSSESYINSSQKAELFRTEISPSGEYILRMGYEYTGTHPSFFSVHQSQSSVPGGFDFSHHSSSDSVVFTTPWQAKSAQTNLARPYGKWISDTEFAVGLWTNAQALSGSNTLSGAGWPSGDFAVAGGVFAILSGSGTDWNVVYWASGSSTTGPAADGETAPRNFRQASAMAINHRYTTTETDRIALYSTGLYNSNYVDNHVTVFAKTSGSWGWHSQFSIATGYSPDRIDWLDSDQDHLGIIARNSSYQGYLEIYQPSQSVSNSNIKYSLLAFNNRYNHSSIVWDPYNNKFRVTVADYIATFNSSSAWYDKIGSNNTYLSFGDANYANYPDEAVDIGADTFTRNNTDMTGCDMEYWRFRSGSAALLWPNGLGQLRRPKGLRFAESGSNGWHVPMAGWNSHDILEWDTSNDDNIVLQGGDNIKQTLTTTAVANQKRQFEVMTHRANGGVATPYIWHTDKGASGELIYTVEPQANDDDRITGRNIFYRLNAYDGVTPYELPAVTSRGTGSTNYEISSSFDSLNWEIVTAPQHDYMTNYQYSARGGKFSPDGKYIAQASIYGGQASSLTTRYGIDLYKSGSSGWEWYTFLTSSESNYIQDYAWASNGEIWATYGHFNTRRDAQRWVSSSATGWPLTSSALFGTKTEGSFSSPNNYTGYYNRIEFNADRTAAVLYAQQSNESLADADNLATFGIMISGASGFSDVTTFLNSQAECYKKFQWISNATNTEQDYRVIAVDDDRVSIYNVLTASGDIRADQWYQSYQQQYIDSEVTPSGEYAYNLFIYHSASDSIIYDHSLGTSNDDNVALMVRSVNPLGELYSTGSTNSSYHGYNNRLKTVQAFNPTDENYSTNKRENLHNNGLHADMDFLLRSSSANNGPFFISTGVNAYYDRPAARFAQVKDPSTEDRFLFVAGWENTNNGLKLSVVEKGSDGWKHRQLYELTGSSLANFPAEDNWTLMSNRHGYDISINGDLLIPATGSITGFQVARVSGMGTVADPALESASSTSITAASGGTVSAGGTQSTPRASVSIPASALASDTTIGVDVSDTSSPGQLGLGVNGDESLSPLVSLTPHGTTFSSAVTVTFNLIGSGQGTCPANAQLWKRNGPGQSWYPVPSNLYSCSDGVITLSTTSFSDYIIIGGQKVARTKLNNVQLARLQDANKVLPEAINITGSSESYITSIVDADSFLVQSNTGFTAPISASDMASYFASAVASTTIDVTAKSDSQAYGIVFTTGSTATALSKDNDTFTFNPSTNTLTLAGSGSFNSGSFADALGVAGTLDVDGAAVFNGAVTLGNAGTDVITSTGRLTASAGIHIDGGILNVDTAVDIDVPSGQDFALNTAGDGGDILLTAGSGGDIVLSTDGGGFASIDASTDITIGGSGGTPKLGRVGTTTEVLGALSGAAGLEIGTTATIGTGLTVTSGGATITAGGLTVSAGDSSVQKLTVNGDLVVAGTTTTVDSTNTLIQDPLLVLGSSSNGSASLGDRGILFDDADGTNQLFMWDNSEGHFTLGATTSAHDATGNFNITAGDLKLRDLTGSAATFTGTVTANSFSGDGSGLSGVGASVANEADSSSDHFLTFVAATSSAASFLIESGSLKYNPSDDALRVSSITAPGAAGTDTNRLFFDSSNVNLNLPSGGGSVKIVANGEDNLVIDRSSMGGWVKIHSDTISGGNAELIISGATGEVKIDSALVPNADDTYDLGSATLAWQDLYLEGDVHLTDAGTIQTDAGALTISGASGVTVSSAADFDEGMTIAAGKDILGDGQLDVKTSAGNLTLSGAAGATISSEVTLSSVSDLAIDASDATHFVLVQDSDDNIVKKESVGDLVSAITGSGIQAASGIISIDYVEDFATQYATGSILDSTFLTATLSQEPLADSVQVYLNGMLLVQSGSGREVSSSTSGIAAIFDYKYVSASRQVQFVDALDEDDVIQIKYIKK